MEGYGCVFREGRVVGVYIDGRKCASVAVRFVLTT